MSSVLLDVAQALHVAEFAPEHVSWWDLSPAEKARYEVMAAAALAVRLTVGGEPYGHNYLPRP